MWTAATTTLRLRRFASAINSAGIGVQRECDYGFDRVAALAGEWDERCCRATHRLAGRSTGASVGQRSPSRAARKIGQDASLTVDGVAITSPLEHRDECDSRCDVSTAGLPRRTLRVQVEITNDNTDIGTAMSNFVTAYNAVVNDINGQERNDSSGNPEPLFGSPTLALIAESAYGSALCRVRRAVRSTTLLNWGSA